MDNLERLEAELTKHCQKLLATTFSTQAVDKAEIPAALRALYKHLQKPEPKVVYVDSPWQMLALAGVLKTDLSKEHLSSANVRQGPLANTRQAVPNKDNLMAQLWKRLDEQIDESTREKLRSYGRKHREAFNAVFNPFSGSFMNFATVSSREPWFALGVNLTTLASTTSNQLAGVTNAYFQTSTNFSEGEARYLADLYERIFPIARRDEVTTSLQANLREQLTELFMPLQRLTPDEKPFSATDFVNDVGAFIGGDREKFRIVPKEQEIYFDLLTNVVLMTNMLFWSSSSLGRLPYYDFLIQKIPALPIGPTNKRFVRAYLNFCKLTPCALLQDEICFVCEAPLVYVTDDSRRMHSEHGPAIAFGDGYKIFAWHGTMVPEWVIEKPYAITVDKIIQEPNNEVRRVMIDRFGMERFIKDSGASIVHQDEFGMLFRKELGNDEPLVMVKVKNSSPEPDGTFRDYFLRVPPTIRTAKAAVAWTFNMKPEEYSPSRES